MKVTEFIEEDFKNWGNALPCNEDTERRRTEVDNVVFISAPTGTGKTTFILHTFSEFVIREKKGRILILVPRTILQEQMQCILMDYFAEKDNLQEYVSSIRVMTYQALENAVLNGEKIGKFYAVVCDEAHYFVEDSFFNVNVQVSFDWLCEFISNESGIVICQSATLDLFQETLIERLKLEPVEVKTDNRKKCMKDTLDVVLIRNGERRKTYYEYKMEQKLSDKKVAVRYLTSDKEMEDILVYADGKRLCFVSSKKRGEELQESLQNKHQIKTKFVTAENKASDGLDVVSDLVYESKFSSDVLIATSVLDVGVNILDKEVSTVILDTCDQTTFVQMLGRIRLTEGQAITIYILKRDVRYFKNWKKNIVPRMQFQIEILKHSEEHRALKIIQELMQEKGYVDGCAFMIHRGKLYFNTLLQKKLCSQLLEFNNIIAGIEKDSEYFIKQQLSWLGLEDTFSVQHYAWEEIRKQRGKAVIEAIRKKCKTSFKEGLTHEKMSEILQQIKEDVRSLDKEYLRSDENLSVTKFRNICQKEFLPFTIVQREVDKKQIYWLIDCSNDKESAGSLQPTEQQVSSVASGEALAPEVQ